MSDKEDLNISTVPPDMDVPSPPSLNAIEQEKEKEREKEKGQKLGATSRKREREVSIELVSTPKASDIDENIIQEQRDTRTSVKRNKRLESTVEENWNGSEESIGKRYSSGSSSRSHSHSHSHSVSPPLITAAVVANANADADVKTDAGTDANADADIGAGADADADADVNAGAGAGTVSPRQELENQPGRISPGVEDPKSGPEPGSGIGTRVVEAVVDKDTEMVEPFGSGLKPSSGVEQKSVEVEKKESESSGVVSPEKELSKVETVEKDGGTAVTIDGSKPGPSNDKTKTHLRVQSESNGNEKGLKRRFGERGTSQGPQEEGPNSTDSSEPLKRPRDDTDADPNPRETKRPTPPPEKSPKPSPPSPKIAKLSGFMAYASTSSPFANVKGQNIFSSKGSTSITSFASPASSNSISGFGESSLASSPAPLKRSGFEAFASSSSPFSSTARSKSPVLGQTSKLGRAKSPPLRTNSLNSNPFASYLGSNQGFAVPAQKRARAGSPLYSSQSSLEKNLIVNNIQALEPNRSESPEEVGDDEEKSSSFGAKLRATKDEEDGHRSDDETKVHLTEQEIITGEEEEETIHQVRGKLFSLDGNQWKERGTGQLRLNVKRSDGHGARLVMRKEAVYTLLLNVTLFHGMHCTVAQDPRYLLFSAIEDGNTTHYNLRVANAKIAQELLEEIQANIPSP